MKVIKKGNDVVTLINNAKNNNMGACDTDLGCGGNGNSYCNCNCNAD